MCRLIYAISYVFTLFCSWNEPHIRSFWYTQLKLRLWDKYVNGISDTDRIANKLSPVAEFERRDTEIIDLALELEKLTNSKKSADQKS